MADNSSPIPYDINTPSISPVGSPVLARKSSTPSVELIDGFYKFKAMEEMNSKTKQFGEFWMDVYGRWEMLNGLLEAGYTIEQVRISLECI